MRPEEIARRLKEALIEVSPAIEEFTSMICPLCTDVCCRQKHAFPEERDLLFMKFLNTPFIIPDGRDPEGPCQFLGERGCIKERWQRPLRCTWYFCEDLLKAMDEAQQKKVRRLIGLIKEIVLLSKELLESQKRLI